MVSSKKLLLVGCGKMGAALLTGWLKNDFFSEIKIIDPFFNSNLEEENVTILDSVDKYQSTPDVIVFAIKPQIFSVALPDYSQFENALFISIAAGQSVDKIGSLIGEDKRIIRVMPNTPASIGHGMSVLYANKFASNEDKELSQNLMEVCGQTLWIDKEDDMHAVTALSGSGPAYVFHMIEALAEAGRELGLASDVAMTLARQTVEGSAMLSAADKQTAVSVLRENVTSPQGTTWAGLTVLMNDHEGLPKLMKKTLEAAKSRSIVLDSLD